MDLFGYGSGSFNEYFLLESTSNMWSGPNVLLIFLCSDTQFSFPKLKISASTH